MSGLPDATIRKIFSGETSDPRFETVVKLVNAMGGSLNDIVEKKEETPELNAVIALKEVYEKRIEEWKASSGEQIQCLRRDKKFLAIVSCVLLFVLIGILAVDLLVGSVGWFRY